MPRLLYRGGGRRAIRVAFEEPGGVRARFGERFRRWGRCSVRRCDKYVAGAADFLGNGRWRAIVQDMHVAEQGGRECKPDDRIEAISICPEEIQRYGVYVLRSVLVVGHDLEQPNKTTTCHV